MTHLKASTQVWGKLHLIVKSQSRAESMRSTFFSLILVTPPLLRTQTKPIHAAWKQSLKILTFQRFNSTEDRED